MKHVRSPEAQKAVSSWCAKKPKLTAYFDSLNEKDISWGVFSNSAKQLLTHSPEHLVINDLDILIAEEQFEDVARLTPDAMVRTCFVEIRSADGARLSYPADEISTTIDGVPIQIMRSPDGIDRDGEHTYYVNMTELAANHTKAVSTGDTDIVFAHPLDTIAAKAMLQRPLPKHDLNDARQLGIWGELHDPEHAPYLQQRIEEMQLDERAYRFLGEAGLRLAVELTA